LVEQPARRLAIRTAATRRARLYGWDAVSKRTMGVLETLVDHGRTPAAAPPPAATAVRSPGSVGAWR
jgi:hypothetical protein